MPKANYEKPTSLLDLEARQRSDYQPSSVLIEGQSTDPSDNGYVGVDVIYQNYANETERPLLAEKGAEAKVEAPYYSDDVDTTVAAAPEGQGEGVEDGESQAVKDPSKEAPSATGASLTPPSGGGTPPSSGNK